MLHGWIKSVEAPSASAKTKPASKAIANAKGRQQVGILVAAPWQSM
jgi:hypothetical protein